MDKKDLISIIVPVYNIKNEIKRCVDSIKAQSLSNIEIILVDDGSTDGSASVIDELKKADGRIIVVHKENGGVTSARLKGVEVATGEWIGFVDGDDYIEPDMYEILLSNALKYNADISHCGYQMVFPSRVDYYYNTGRLVKQDKLTGLKDLLEGSFIEPGLCNKLFHKTLFHSLLHDDVMDFSIKQNEDLLMNYYLFKKASNSIYKDFCPYHYLVRVGSAANSEINENELNDPLKVYKKILQDTENNSCLYSIALSQLANFCINVSSRKKRKAFDFEKKYISLCQNELKKINSNAAKENFNSALKIKIFICSIAPGFYGCIHRLYKKIIGIDKKYEVR